jgi:FkbM family methyltransferase
MRRALIILKFIMNHPIAKKRKIKALFRFIFWQLFSRISNKSKIFTFVNGTKLQLKKGQTVATGNYYTGLFEFIEMSFVLQFLKQNDVFFDVGANIGAYSIAASSYTQATTLSFEPVFSTYNQLLDNIKINSPSLKIFPYNIGLSNKPGLLKFTLDRDANNHVIADLNSELKFYEVEVQTIDNFIERKPALIKLDVEGFELFVLQGAVKTLQSEHLKAIIVEVNNESRKYGLAPEVLHNFLTSFGFIQVLYDPFCRTIKPTDKNISDNRIYVKDLDIINSKIKSNPEINIWGIKY